MRAMLVSSAVVFAGCGSLQEGASKLVSIQYDQPRNFDTYTFKDPFNLPGDGTVYGITLKTPEVASVRMWMLYQVCLVANEGSQANPFTLDVGKFFVELGGNEFHPEMLDAADYYTSSGVVGPVSNTDNATIAPIFNSETGNIDYQKSIAAGSTDDEDYRFVIQVDVPVPTDPDYLETRLKLQYDAGGVLLTDRGWDPDPDQDIAYGDLPSTCRQQK